MTLPFRNSMLDECRRQIWRWVPGLIAANITFIGIELGIFQSFQALASNILFQLRGSIGWDERIVVVEIDDESIQDLGQFPIERHYYTEFLDRMDRAQPSVVAFDIVFAEAGKEDAEFAAAIDHLNRVVLAQSWDKKGAPVLPTPRLDEPAVNTGHVLHRADPDGVSRSVQSYVQQVPSLGLAIAQSYSLIAEPVRLPENQNLPDQPFWVNWPGPSEDCPSYSFADVLRGKIPPEVFQNKIVILGVTASGDSQLLTPFDQNPPTGGVYLQAAIVSNLLQQNTLHRMSLGWQFILLTLGGPMLGFFSSYCGCRRRWVSWAGFCFGWNALGLFCLHSNLLIPVVWPVVLVTLTTGLIEAAERLRATAYLQSEIERLWDAYHTDLVSEPHTISPPTPSDSQGFKTIAQGCKFKLDSTSRMGAPGRMVLSASSAQPIAVQRAMQLAQLAELFGRSQSLHATIARNLSIGIIAADWDGTVWLCNPVAASLIHLRIGESLERKLVPDWIPYDDWETYFSKLHESNTFCCEVQKDGNWFELKLELLFYSLQVAPEFYNDTLHTASTVSPQPPTGILVMIQNITTFKQVEDEIRVALAKAVELNELKTRFVSMASHELRNPLTVMRTSIELLRAYGLNISSAKHQDYLERMQTSVNNMKKLIEDVLILGKAGTQRLECHPKLLNLSTFCQELIEQLQPEMGESDRIHLVIQPDDLHCSFDHNLLSLILNNLLSNALKYSPDEAFVDLNVIAQEDMITFEVCDRGIGIPEDDQKHLFSEFQRATNVGSIPGTGLGLSIVKQCVDLHGGTIAIDSQVGIGTTFRVTLPNRIIN